MNDVVIRADNLSKQYRIGSSQVRYRTLRESVMETLRYPLIRARYIFKMDNYQYTGVRSDYIWALRNISFEIRHGEVIGIIGRNGAGKSTLLKILARITEPTEGSADLYGRVGSLLEVGTGFHPELTGQENIYLSGAVLGMRRSEINKRFDEIVAFAEIERFLNTPVKHYSSGMYLRLAFAVSAHLETEILLVDEVLAVGDIEFQRKCLGKMSQVSAGGRTVLFVSHNMDAIQRLCQRGILIKDGQITYDGSAEQATLQYLQGIKSVSTTLFKEDMPRKGDGRVRITAFEVIDTQTGILTRHIPAGASFTLRVHFTANETIVQPRIGVALLTATGVRVFNSVQMDSDLEVPRIHGKGIAEITVSNLILSTGSYLCNLAISDRSGSYCDYIVEIPCLEITPSPLLSQVRTYDQSSGVVYAQTTWRVSSLE